MENGSFLTSHLGNLDILSENEVDARSIPTPNEMPTRLSLAGIPEDILKTSTIESLISQNEDLMARLKVTLLRLSALENENKKFIEENQKLRLAYSSVSDQLLVHKEKDYSWKDRINQIEKEKVSLELISESYKLKIDEIERALSEANSTIQVQSIEIERYKKYHEKIKVQVKPYIHQLKEFIAEHELQIEKLKNELATKDAMVSEIRHQITELTKNAKIQMKAAEQQQADLVAHFETCKTDLERENLHLRESLKFYEVKGQKLDKALERNDFLENQVVATQREMEQLITRFESENNRINEKMTSYRQENQKQQIFIQQLSENIEKYDKENSAIKSKNEELSSQYDSLKYLYAEKTEELEKLKLSFFNLEKINADLSKKLQESRQQFGGAENYYSESNDLKL